MFNTDEIYADAYGDARKVISSQYVGGDLHWIMLRGFISDGKFRTVESDNKYVIRRDLPSGFKLHVEQSFKYGDLLASKDGKLFVYEDENTVWSTNDRPDESHRMFWASLRTRTLTYGELKLVVRGFSGNNRFGAVAITERMK